MTWMKKFSAILMSCLAFICFFPQRVRAMDASWYSDGLYHIVDYSGTDAEYGSYDTYEKALKDFDAAAQIYQNAAIVKDGTVLKAERAFVLFNRDDACSLDLEMEYSDHSTTTVNGCYGIDAAYISTSDDGQTVNLLLSGAELGASISDVTILPIENSSVRLSTYSVIDGHLYHQIKNEIDDENYYDEIDLGPAPSLLNAEGIFLSYDGHYFYNSDSMWALEDDLHAGTHAQAINPDDPWYYYYQFVSHRTVTSVSYKTAQSYINDTMGTLGQLTSYSDMDLDGASDDLSRSQYYGMMPAFWQYQYEYGANALMMLAVSVNESSWGRSSLAFSRNNLYRHAAYDTEEEAAVSRYFSVEDSIYSHAKYYISGTYASPVKTTFAGSFFGNKSAGMNVNYSSDPYWGEKAASAYEKLDEDCGGSDGNAYTLGIRTVSGETNVYDEPDGSVLYGTGDHPDMSFIILGETDTDTGHWYKVQSEATISEEGSVDLSYNYSFTNDIGYIRAEDIQLSMAGTLGGEPSYHTVTFDGAGGEMVGSESSVSYEIIDGQDAASVEPVKDHALFNGWDGSSDAVSGDLYLTAQYKDVDRIEFSEQPKTDYELNDRIDLSQGKIMVYFTDGTTQEVGLATSEVSGFDFSVGGTQEITVSYAGCTLTYEVNVSEEKDQTRTDTKQEILDVIEKYKGRDSLSDDECNEVLQLKEKIDATVLPYLTIGQTRDIDQIMRLAYGNKIHYIVESNSYSFGVSGLGISIPLGDSLTKNSLFSDTYRVRVHHGISSASQEAMQKVAEFLDQTPVDTFTVRLLKNYTDASTQEPLVFSIAKPNDTQLGDLYTVLQVDDNGDVIKCYTRQSTGRISFMAKHPGEFLLVKESSSNQYTGEDPVEVVTHETSSFDREYAFVLISVGAAVLLGVLAFVMRWLKKRRLARAVVQHAAHQDDVKKEVENLEVTQALHILDTSILDLNEVKKADQEAKDNDDQHDGTDSGH